MDNIICCMIYFLVTFPISRANFEDYNTLNDSLGSGTSIVLATIGFGVCLFGAAIACTWFYAVACTWCYKLLGISKRESTVEHSPLISEVEPAVAAQEAKGQETVVVIEHLPDMTDIQQPRPVRGDIDVVIVNGKNDSHDVDGEQKRDLDIPVDENKGSILKIDSHDVVANGGVLSPIVMDVKSRAEASAVRRLLGAQSTSTPDEADGGDQDEKDGQTKNGLANGGASSKTRTAPPPLNIDDMSGVDSSAGTPALREQYEKGRIQVLQMTDEQLKAIPAHKLEDEILRYLSPAEIWQLKERLSVVIPEKLDLSEAKQMTGDETEKLSSQMLSDMEEKRRSFMSLIDSELLRMPLAEIESFYPYLSGNQILAVQQRTEQLKLARADLSETGRSSESFNLSNHLRYHSTLSSSSKSYLESMTSKFSFDEDKNFNDKEAESSMSGLELREKILNAPDDFLLDFSKAELDQALKCLTVEEIADTNLRLMLAKEARRAMLLAYTKEELLLIDEKKLSKWLSHLNESETATIRSRMTENVSEASRSQNNVLDSTNMEDTRERVSNLLETPRVRLQELMRLSPNISLSSVDDSQEEHSAQLFEGSSKAMAAGHSDSVPYQENKSTGSSLLNTSSEAVDQNDNLVDEVD